MSAGSFNLYFNLPKTLTDAAKELLQARTTDPTHDFYTTDAMKTNSGFEKCFQEQTNVTERLSILLNRFDVPSLRFLWGEQVVKHNF